MLNRTNRTLSAHTNRLNLGTRKLDQNASANIGSLTLRTAHADHVVDHVRAGFVMYPGFPTEGPTIFGPKPEEPAMPSKSGSSSRSPWASQAQPTWDQQQGQPVALASQPVGTVVVRSGDHGTVRFVPPPRSSSPRLRSRPDLDRRCEAPRLADRSVLADLVSATAS